MKVLVTGGAGFIGSHLTLALQHLGHQVTVIDDLSNGLESNLDLFPATVNVVRASILDEHKLAAAAEGVDVIFHLAAVSNVAQTINEPLLAHAVNATGTLNVLEAARRENAHIVFSSSAAVYGNTAQVPTREDSSCQPISLYGSQKLLGEHYIRNYCQLFNLSAVCLRYFNVYGSRQRADSPYSGVISKFLELARQDEPISVHGTGEQTRDFVAVEDVVRANILAAESRLNGQPFNVCTGSGISVRELADHLVALTSSKSQITFGPSREGDILHSRGNATAARDTLGFTSEIAVHGGLRNLIA